MAEEEHFFAILESIVIEKIGQGKNLNVGVSVMTVLCTCSTVIGHKVTYACTVRFQSEFPVCDNSQT